MKPHPIQWKGWVPSHDTMHEVFFPSVLALPELCEELEEAAVRTIQYESRDRRLKGVFIKILPMVEGLANK